MDNLSECLRLLRVVNDIKQKEFAVKLGISAPYLSEIESGKKKPSFEVLSKYSEVLSIPVSSIMFFSEQTGGHVVVNKIRVSIQKAILSYMSTADKV